MSAPAPWPETVPFARPIWGLPVRVPELPGSEILLAGRSTAWGALIDIGILISVVFAVSVAVVTLILAQFEGEPDPDLIDTMTREFILPLTVVRVVAATGAVLCILKWRGQSLSSVGATMRGFWLNLPIGGLAAAFAGVCGFVVMIPLLAFWPEIIEQMNQNAENISAFLPPLSPPGMAGLMLLVAFWEELFFRGFLMTRIRRASNSWTVAVIVSTAMFVAPHLLEQTPAAMIPLTILSLVFSAVTIWRRSLVPAIVGHAAYNLGTVVFLTLQAGDSWT